MSVQSDTRAAVSSRWIRAALAAFVLASGATLLAQNDQKEKERPPAPAHKTTPPPANHTNTPPAGGQSTGHPSGQPSYTQSQHSGTPPASTPAVRPYSPPPRPTGNTPGNNPQNRPTGSTPGYNSPRPAGNQPYNPPSRPTTGGQPTPYDRSRPSGGPVNGSHTGYTPGPSSGNRPAYHGPNGTEVHYRPNGQPQVVRTGNGTVITHSQSGVARAEYVRPDRSVIVTRGTHYGYVQRPFVVNNVSYVRRTYVVGGVTYGRFYRPYLYHGVSLNLYVSSHYYAPAFYGWAYSPWSRPIVYNFGWGARPWFGYYGGYFAPYPTYAGPAYWLTDYMIAMTLQDAYQVQQAQAAAAQYDASYPAPGGQPALTPDVKQAIADEVHRQLDQERMEGQGGAPAQSAPAFLADNASHVFVVSNGLDVQSSGGECSLTDGDVLQMTAPPSPNAAMADLAVMASKGPDCRKGAIVSVAIADLQDMQNHMRETLDQGLSELQKNQGQGGIPALPPAANRPPVDAPFMASAPPPDPNVASEVSQQAESAAQAENEVLDQVQGPPPADAGLTTQSVSLGMSIDQVVGIMGQPQVKADLGSKKIYTYGNMKIIFIDGRVSDVQ